MAKSFIYDDISSREIGLKCKEINHLTFASKSYESIKIPGRTGNLLIDDGSLQNKEIKVVAFLDLRKSVYKKERLQHIKRWLIGHIGYRRLRFDDGTEYQAIVKGAVEITELKEDYLELTIVFECMEVLE